MSVYVFSSTSDVNVRAALYAGKWAFSESKRPGVNTRMTIGDKVLFYSTESKSILGAAVIIKPPCFGKTLVGAPWAGTWYDPIDLYILAINEKGVPAKEILDTSPSSRSNNTSWYIRAVLTNNCAPSTYTDEDFMFVLNKLM
jgi:hypothetical protein